MSLRSRRPRAQEVTVGTKHLAQPPRDHAMTGASEAQEGCVHSCGHVFRRITSPDESCCTALVLDTLLRGAKRMRTSPAHQTVTPTSGWVVPATISHKTEGANEHSQHSSGAGECFQFLPTSLTVSCPPTSASQPQHIWTTSMMKTTPLHTAPALPGSTGLSNSSVTFHWPGTQPSSARQSSSGSSCTFVYESAPLQQPYTFSHQPYSISHQRTPIQQRLSLTCYEPTPVQQVQLYEAVAVQYIPLQCQAPGSIAVQSGTTGLHLLAPEPQRQVWDARASQQTLPIAAPCQPAKQQVWSLGQSSGGPRFLLELSPASLARGCQPLWAGPVCPARRSTPPLTTENTSLINPIQLPMDMHDIMAAAMRLLGHKERTTLLLAMHCWNRIGDHVRMVWRSPYATPAEVERGAALTVLWCAAKCEEERKGLCKPSMAACLLPATLAALGVAGLAALEVKVMVALDWRPYWGFLHEEQLPWV